MQQSIFQPGCESRRVMVWHGNALTAVRKPGKPRQADAKYLQQYWSESPFQFQRIKSGNIEEYESNKCQVNVHRLIPRDRTDVADPPANCHVCHPEIHKKSVV